MVRVEMDGKIVRIENDEGDAVERMAETTAAIIALCETMEKGLSMPVGDAMLSTALERLRKRRANKEGNDGEL